MSVRFFVSVAAGPAELRALGWFGVRTGVGLLSQTGSDRFSFKELLAFWLFVPAWLGQRLVRREAFWDGGGRVLANAKPNSTLYVIVPGPTRLVG